MDALVMAVLILGFTCVGYSLGGMDGFAAGWNARDMAD